MRTRENALSIEVIGYGDARSLLATLLKSTEPSPKANTQSLKQGDRALDPLVKMSQLRIERQKKISLF